MIRRILLTAFASLFLTVPGLLATDRHVTVTGAGSHNGTVGNEYSFTDLMTAAPTGLAAGDHVWVHSGRYNDLKISGNPSYNYDCVNGVGTASAPILVQAWPGDRAIIDSNDPNVGDINSSGAGLLIDFGCHDITFQDLEFDSSATAGNQQTDRSHAYIPNGNTATRIKFVNCMFHDSMSMAITVFPTGLEPIELYGNVVVYTGSSTVSGHRGYFIYLNENTPAPNGYGPVIVRDNIVGPGSRWLLHGYASASGATQNNVVVEGNTLWMASSLDGTGTRVANELLLGTDANATMGTNCRIAENYTYTTDLVNNGDQFGYLNGIDTLNAIANYIIGSLRFDNTTNNNLTLTTNTINGNMYENGTQHFPTQAQWPSNVINDVSTVPVSGKVIFRRSNRYEPGRMNVTIYNWDHSATVNVDISQDDKGAPGVRVGDSYAIYWAPNFAAKIACATGIYAGGTVSIPINSLGSMPTPHYWSTPASVAPEFAAFIVQTTKRVN